MRRASGLLILALAVGPLGLLNSAQAGPIRSYDRVVDMGRPDNLSVLLYPQVNESGQIVQYKETGTYQIHQIVDKTRPGYILGYSLNKEGDDTNLLPGSLLSTNISFSAPNASGHIAGFFVGDRINEGSYYFAPEAGHISSLKPLAGTPQRPQIFSINNLDQIVGWQDSVALYYASPTSEPVAIADLLGTDTGWKFIHASGINDKGQIVGYGINPEGIEANFRLDPSPVPEPSSLALFAVAGVMIASRRFVKRQ